MANQQERLADDLHWLGGIIDGEGCIALVKTRTSGGRTGFQPRLTIGNTDVRILERIVNILGQGRINKRKERLGWQTFYTIDLTNNGMAILLPKLTLTSKTEQAELVLEAIILLREHNAVTGQPHLARLAEIRNEISTLNGRSKGARKE